MTLEGCPADEVLSQSWEHSRDGLLRHRGSGLCLDTEGATAGQGLVANTCDVTKYSQRWEFSLMLND